MSEQSDREQVQVYREMVLRYESLDEQIDALIMGYGGTSDRMPPEAHTEYRQLANQRDELLSDIRAMEQELFPDQ